MATVIGDISESALAEEVELVLFDTKKQTPEQRPLWQGVAARLGLWSRWWRAIGGRGQTIAHIHTCSGLSYFLDGTLALLAGVRGAPVVLHVHGATFDAFLDSQPQLLRRLAQWLARRASRIVVLSDEWEETLGARLPGAQLVVIENGVPIPPPIERDAGETGEVTILFLGNLGKRKGVWELLEAAGRMSGDARIVLVGGEEDPGIADRFRAEVTAKGLTSRIEYVGPAYGEEKHRWLARADVFVLPSHAEGLPISLLEAMAAGLPVVVTPVGGIPSVIRDGEDGLLVEPGDAASLAAALERLAGDAELRKRLGDAARACCADRFGIDNVARRYLDLYRDVVARRGGA